jgi:hypothetical protein
MKRILVIIAIAFCIFTFTTPEVWARGRMQGDIASCRGADCAEVRTYSRAAFETVSGEVIDIYEATSKQGYRSGLHLLLKANEETIDVHLGPISYIEGQNFHFEPGDALEIKGDHFTNSSMPTMTAIEVKKNNETLILRDEDGFPMWRASLRQ